MPRAAHPLRRPLRRRSRWRMARRAARRGRTARTRWSSPTAAAGPDRDPGHRRSRCATGFRRVTSRRHARLLRLGRPLGLQGLSRPPPGALTPRLRMRRRQRRGRPLAVTSHRRALQLVPRLRLCVASCNGWVSASFDVLEAGDMVEGCSSWVWFGFGGFDWSGILCRLAAYSDQRRGQLCRRFAAGSVAHHTWCRLC